MSNRNGFTGGFLAGAIFGSVVGGVLGTVLATRTNTSSRNDDESSRLPERDSSNPLLNPEGMESARRNLEDKIAQLNDTIDDVREQLHVVNRQEQPDRPLSPLDDQ
ncbi:hypothetical protein NEA10_09495 [Phormidium yuhuli AB48]|uniref:Gas vesicle protein n=1 Tax=Phormidium yuhuli AB48 TaxID=2940671 RepID=A0ABY5AUL2_9CYAN|nr:hypothetical protein [Phormidium yuhuli]USR92925.1 hypothetical protein NEA10_09495 [Phormidium yuhuli AB48]